MVETETETEPVRLLFSLLFGNLRFSCTVGLTYNSCSQSQPVKYGTYRGTHGKKKATHTSSGQKDACSRHMSICDLSAERQLWTGPCSVCLHDSQCLMGKFLNMKCYKVNSLLVLFLMEQVLIFSSQRQ